MTAVITASRWNAIDPNYKTGSPTTAPQAFSGSPPTREPSSSPPRSWTGGGCSPSARWSPLPGRCVLWWQKEPTPPACCLVTVKATGARCPPTITTPTTRRSAAGSASSAPTTWVPPACGSSPTPRWTARGRSGVRPRYATTLLLPSEY